MGTTHQLVQETSGCYKPLSKPFRTKDGLSTVPILMEGHPDDVPGGKLISTEVRHSAAMGRAWIVPRFFWYAMARPRLAQRVLRPRAPVPRLCVCRRSMTLRSARKVP